MCSVWFLPVLCILLLNTSNGVIRDNYKTCEQSSFCIRCRDVQPGQSKYEFQLNTLQVGETSIQGDIIDTESSVIFNFQLFALVDNTFRMKIDESAPITPRYQVEHVLVSDPIQDGLQVLELTEESVTVQSGTNRATVHSTPFQIDFYSGDQLVISTNARGLMKFEYLQEKQESNQHNTSSAWEEVFKTHRDSRALGPSALAIDFSFIGAHHSYGIPEHADSFALKSTRSADIDPYRLYNLDVADYEVGNGMALYGSVPVLIAHGESHTVGVFWLNSAETWVDIENSGDQTGADPQVDAHFMSESGIMDVFFMLGPNPEDVLRQNSNLTGTAHLPPIFALAYHQSRWNYHNQDDILNVDAGFDEHDMPMDVMWLDIQHTDAMKYFTWDPVKFSTPIEMTHSLIAKGRKVVTIVDPHIKRDDNYFLHIDAESNGYYVKTPDGQNFIGDCWPGASSYLDFYDPVVRDYYRDRYLLENYFGSTLDTYNWNDMDEPSVFDGPEVTMPKDLVHYGGWQHRDVHNTYGFMNTMSTFAGQRKRSNGTRRPFVLTRAHFAGTQRYAAIWTGDNTAEWGHLIHTIPMCLSESVAGISFCGADVGGFAKTPSAELMIRWYQAAAYQPFMRAHSSRDTLRQEPWLFGDEATVVIREALRQRYALLPYLYTLFFEHQRTGMSVMRPLWFEFPKEVATFAIDNEYLLGGSILVCPVTVKFATNITVHLPGGNDQLWYHIGPNQVYSGGSTILPVSLDTVPAFQRGGTIVSRKMRPRSSSVHMQDDPYTLTVALDNNGTASGTLYIDDGQSYDYQQGSYLYYSIEFESNTIHIRNIDGTTFPSAFYVEQIIILGPMHYFTSAQLTSSSLGKVLLSMSYNTDMQSLTVQIPAINLVEEWSIFLD